MQVGDFQASSGMPAEISKCKEYHRTDVPDILSSLLMTFLKIQAMRQWRSGRRFLDDARFFHWFCPLLCRVTINLCNRGYETYQ